MIAEFVENVGKLTCEKSFSYVHEIKILEVLDIIAQHGHPYFSFTYVKTYTHMSPKNNGYLDDIF